MVIVLTAGASLRPLPFIIFSAKFLTDRWIGHIEQAKEKTAEMGKVGDAPSHSLYRRKEFDEAENDDKVFGRNGEQKVKVDGSIGKEPAKSKKYSIDSSGSSNHWDALKLVGSKENGTDTRTDATE